MANNCATSKGRCQKGYTADIGQGNFGCREWGYYLKSEQHPYIDITSYGNPPIFSSGQK